MGIRKRYFLKWILILMCVYTAIILVMAVFSLRSLWNLERELKLGYIDSSLIPQKKQEIPRYFNIISGAPSQTPEEALVASLAVIIDNHPKSFPQEGLDKADVVFEVPVEGGATRFLAFFNADNTVPKIGPVRSARRYFADMAGIFQSLIAHSGGSPEAILYLKGNTISVIDVDEIGPEGKYFWRDMTRSAPHNLFTSSAFLQDALKTLKKERENYLVYENVAWSWLDQKSEKDALRENFFLQTKNSNEASDITIDYSTFTYQVEYKYNPERRRYARFQGGAVLKTSDQEEIFIDNILIAYMPVAVIDNEGRLKIEDVGSGEALVCMYGICLKTLWQREAQNKQIVFLQHESPVKFIPFGRTWIHIVPIGRKVTLSNSY